MDVKSLRLQLGLTQGELAEKLEVAPLTIRRWEKGQTQMHPGNKNRLERLAKAMLAK